MTDWSRLVEEIKPYIVKIETPHGSGTGFQIGEDAKWAYAITVTAHHVIAFAEEWRLPIKITREAPSESLKLPPAAPGGSRIRRTRQDASSLFLPVKRHLPQITLHPASLPVGTEVGWLGYPGSVSGGKLAFFSGRISVVLHEERNYLLDGVVLPGVSGAAPTCFLGGMGRSSGGAVAAQPSRPSCPPRSAAQTPAPLAGSDVRDPFLRRSRPLAVESGPS